MNAQIALFSRQAIALLFVTLPLFGVFMGRVSEVILSICVGLIALEALCKGRFMADVARLFVRLKTPLGLVFLAVFLWVITASFWALKFDSAIKTCSQALGLIAAGFVLVDYVQKYPFKHLNETLLRTLLLACLVYGLMIVLWRLNMPLAHQFYNNLSIFNRPATGFWLLAIPLFVAFGRSKLTLLLLVGMTIVTFSTISTSSALAAGLVVSLYFLSKINARAVFHVTMAICGLFIAFVPILAHWPLKYGPSMPFYNIFGPSSTHRMAIWDNFATLTEAKPWLGWGANSSRMMLDNPALKLIPLNNPELNIGMHPHNFSLQVWVELGAVGAMLVLIIWGLLWLRLKQLAPARLTFASMFVAAAFGVSCVNYSLWQGWWISYIAFGIALFVQQEK